MKNAKTLVYLLAASSLLLTMTACSKCSGGGQGNKQDYIAALDAKCLEVAQKATPIAQEMGSVPKEDISAKAAILDRIKALRDDYAAQIEKVAPRPSEDAATLTEFFAENNKVGEAFIAQVKAMKVVGEESAKARAEIAQNPDAPVSEPLVQATAEMNRHSDELNAASVKVDEIARRYGFKVCGIQPH
jgi:hypothetical protein